MSAVGRANGYRRALHGNCCDYFGRGGRYPYEVEEAEGGSRGAGRPLVRWVVEAAKEAGADRVVTVVGHMRDQVIPLVEGDTEIVVQEAQRGTADAVLAAADALAGFDGAVVVLSGDSPLIQPETIRQMAALREEHNAAVIVLTMELENPFGYGRIVRDGAGEVARIVEQKDASPEEAAITGVQLRRLLFRRPRPFRRCFPR